MMHIEQLQREIEALPEHDYARLRQWFAELDWQRWGRQLEADVNTGKLDFLLEEARASKEQGTLQAL